MRISGPALEPGERATLVEEGSEAKRIAEWLRSRARRPDGPFFEAASAIEQELDRAAAGEVGRAFGGGQ